MDEAQWRERAQSAESRIETMRQAHESAVERIKVFKSNFGIKERSDGTIDIDFEKFVENLGVENSLLLRKVIDETYQISGEPGKKPHVKLVV